MRARRAISPGARMAISSTQKSSLPVASSTVSGSPTSVFRLPWVRSTWPAGESAAAMSSLVVVFPLEPVTPTTRPPVLLAHGRCQVPQRLARVGHGNDRNSAAAGRPAAPARHHQPGCPGVGCGSAEVEAVDPLARKGEEKPTGS